MPMRHCGAGDGRIIRSIPEKREELALSPPLLYPVIVGIALFIDSGRRRPDYGVNDIAWTRAIS